MSEEQSPHLSHTPTSPSWDRTTKIFVVVITLFLVSLLARRFQPLVGPMVAAAILAYLLNPIIVFINERTRIRRGWIIILIYLLVAAGVIWLLVALGVVAFQQSLGIINTIPALIVDITEIIQTLATRSEPIVIGTFTIDPTTIPWETLGNQLLGFIEPVLSQSGTLIRQIASATMRILAMMFFIFMVSIYIAVEIPQMGGHVADAFQRPGYRADAERLTRDFGRVWSSYLRGQVFLALVIFVVVWLGLSALGVRYALALGIIAGLLEFVPNVGAIVSTGIALAFAIFQPANYLGLEADQLALAVLIFMILVQQIENNILVPRIVGNALDLHPLIVIIGVFMGSSMAGVLGAVLAAPIIATIKLVSSYGWRKLFDLPPFPDPEKVTPTTPSTALLAQGKQLASRFSQKLVNSSAKLQKTPPPSPAGGQNEQKSPNESVDNAESGEKTE